MIKDLEFWFEFASTYSYPAAMRVEQAAADAGVKLIWRPFLLGPVFAARGLTNSPFNMFPAKGAYMWRDMERICAAEGLGLQTQSRFPRGSLIAARVAAGHADAPWIGDLVRAIYGANFAEDRDIDQPEVVHDILATIGQDADAILTSATELPAKDRLRALTDEALARGLFGAPSFMVGDELFWGHDRLDAALSWARAAD